MNIFPSQGDIIIATVKKITDFGAFCTLDEFQNRDAFLHVSEISPGWVRSVRDHVKEGQKIVTLVIRVDAMKNQVDVSLKRVSEAEKKRKMEAFNLDKRAFKLLERVAIKLGKKPEAASEIASLLKKEYGDIYTAFESASQGKDVTGILKEWATGIADVAKQEIKQKFVKIRSVLKVRSYAANGVEQVKNLLNSVKSLSTPLAKIEIRYVAAPVYFLDVTSPDYKTAEKMLEKVKSLLSTFSPDSTDCQLEKSE